MLERKAPGLPKTALTIAAISLLLAPDAIWAQSGDTKPAATPFKEAAAQAKATGRPLVVLGVSETCSRCQALKQGLATQPELKLLLTQYVSTEVPFGGREFAVIFDGIVRQDEKFRQAIGAPSVFIFTAKGEAVYAGPNNPNGMVADAEFKKLLISGIEKNGGVRGPAAGGKSSLASTLPADLTRAGKLLQGNQPLAAAAIVSKHIQPDGAADEQVAAVVELTGLKVARSKAEEQLDLLVKELSQRGLALLQTALATAGTGDATRGAVQLAELNRVFGGFPSFAGTFEAAWEEFADKSGMPSLQQQAELIDKARQAESAQDPGQAVACYELVVSTYPSTQAAELSKLRITQLKTAKPAAAERLWKSKNGQFSVTASLVSFDGAAAQLLTSEGNSISVPLDALSLEDQRFLQAAKRKE
jgi:hypothetical protein